MHLNLKGIEVLMRAFYFYLPYMLLILEQVNIGYVVHIVLVTLLSYEVLCFPILFIYLFIVMACYCIFIISKVFQILNVFSNFF